MKATIVIRKFKGHMYPALLNSALGLMRHGHHVTAMLDGSFEPINTDLVLQWGYKNPQRERGELFKKQNKNCVVLFMDLGWFDRHNTVLIYDEFLNREKLGKERSHEEFENIEPSNGGKYWLVLQQLEKDANLRNCVNYERFIGDSVDFIRKNSKLPVFVRPHPAESDKNRLRVSGVDYLEGNSLREDLDGARAVVTWNSSAVLAAMARKIPCVVYDLPELKKYVLCELTKEAVKRASYGGWAYGNILRKLAGQQRAVKNLISTDFFKLDFQK